jgi:predicted DNA binding CopG/RHH family protein
MSAKKKNMISAEEFDRIFDDGVEDITPYLDLKSARHINLEPKRVSVDVPAWMVQAIDRQADMIGVSRQAFIKFTLHEKLEAISNST